VTASVVYKADEVDGMLVHRSWHEYSQVDLSARVVIFLGRKPSLTPS